MYVRTPITAPNIIDSPSGCDGEDHEGEGGAVPHRVLGVPRREGTAREGEHGGDIIELHVADEGLILRKALHAVEIGIDIGKAIVYRCERDTALRVRQGLIRDTLDLDVVQREAAAPKLRGTKMLERIPRQRTWRRPSRALVLRPHVRHRGALDVVIIRFEDALRAALDSKEVPHVLPLVASVRKNTWLHDLIPKHLLLRDGEVNAARRVPVVWRLLVADHEALPPLHRAKRLGLNRRHIDGGEDQPVLGVRVRFRRDRSEERLLGCGGLRGWSVEERQATRVVREGAHRSGKESRAQRPHQHFLPAPPARAATCHIVHRRAQMSITYYRLLPIIDNPLHSSRFRFVFSTSILNFKIFKTGAGHSHPHEQSIFYRGWTSTCEG